MDELSDFKFPVMPGFVGEYYVAFTDGSERLIALVGAILRTDGTPMYLCDDEGNYYNYYNVIRTRKRVKTNG